MPGRPLRRVFRADAIHPAPPFSPERSSPGHTPTLSASRPTAGPGCGVPGEAGPEPRPPAPLQHSQDPSRWLQPNACSRALDQPSTSTLFQSSQGRLKLTGKRCFLKARAPAASVWPWGWRKDESHPGRTRGSAAQGMAEGAGEAWVCRSSSGSLPGDPRAVARSTARSPVEQGHYYERFLCTSEVSLANCTDRPSQSERWSSTPRLPRDRESLAPRAAKAAPNPADGRCPDQRSGCECQGRGIPIAPRCRPEEPVALLPSTRPLLL